ncbi:hypothetical protein STCU_01306 [Strigomonas culicis]|uniref:Cytochrome b5 heme-binding domain-containing protein n=1 Tax=Strigomonas culicis TaxID=28005 RepID=S9W6C8_9TRYP|nr:hypothetical protein STCU_01306 [Strigomonas culicis]|eukprot:EPY34796.1 hypothetical protein STCU_01306 [Strigomonas culicis]
MSSDNAKKVTAAVVALSALGGLGYFLLEKKGYRQTVLTALQHSKAAALQKVDQLRGKKGAHGGAGHVHQRGTIRPVAKQPPRGFTKEELAEYDGVKKEQIFISLKRKVYEVAPHFYGPGQSYHVFAGKEASRCLAKSQLNDAEANKYWVDCNDEELETLNEYVDLFESKYPVVGWFVPDNSFYDIGK